jgi:anti-sigma factor RsiW
MREDNLHPSDRDLLLASDGELSGSRVAEIRSHLQACWHCRVRMAKMESTIVDFVQAHAHESKQPFPPAAGPRALLKARLAESAASASPSAWALFRQGFHLRALAYAFALFLVIALGANRLLHRHAGDASSPVVLARVLPNPQLTPGATRPVALGDLCAAPHDDVVRAVPGALQRQVLSEYGVSNAHAADYEVDYLITPGLGGAEDIRNLWPEPHADATWNSYVKDQLEERLHDMVCSGQLDLATAQAQIATNWIAAYQKYFGTSRSAVRQRAGLTGASLVTAQGVIVSSPPRPRPPDTSILCPFTQRFLSEPTAAGREPRMRPLTVFLLSQGTSRSSCHPHACGDRV